MITFAFRCYYINSLVFEEKWSNDSSIPQCSPNSDTLGVHLFLMNDALMFWVSDAAVWPINYAHEKIVLIAEDLENTVSHR